VLAGLLRNEPADRLTADDAGAALSAVVLEPVETPAGRAWPRRPSRARVGFAVLAAVVTALLAVVTVLAQRPGGA